VNGVSSVRQVGGRKELRIVDGKATQSRERMRARPEAHEIGRLTQSKSASMLSSERRRSENIVIRVTKLEMRGE
jgi:hypothetical protein